MFVFFLLESKAEAVQFSINRRAVLPKAYSSQKEKTAVLWNRELSQVQHKIIAEENNQNLNKDDNENKAAVREEIYRKMQALNNIEDIVVSDDDSVIDDVQELMEPDSENIEVDDDTDVLFPIVLNDKNNESDKESTANEKIDDNIEVMVSSLNQQKVLHFASPCSAKSIKTLQPQDGMSPTERFVASLPENVAEKYAYSFVSIKKFTSK